MLIKYKTNPDIVTEVFQFTDGRGVDYVLENIGVSSIPTDIQILRKRGGRIAFIGFLNCFEADWPPKLLIKLMVEETDIA